MGEMHWRRHTPSIRVSRSLQVKLLDRYLLSQFIKHYLTVAAGFISIYLLIDFFEKIDNFTSNGKSIWLALKFFLLNVPFILDQLAPILTLLAGIITLGILNHTHELNALKACGIPLAKIIRPLLVGGLLATSVFFCAAQWLLPYTIPAASAIWDGEIKGRLPLGIFRNGRYYYRGAEGFYSFERPDRKALKFKNFSYSEWDEKYNTRSLLSAGRANWLDNEKKWQFSDVQLQKRGEDGRYQIQNLDTLKLQLPETPLEFVVPDNESAERSLTGLYAAIHESRSDWQTTKATSDFYGRISYLLLGLPLLLLGLPTLLHAYQKWGRDLYIAIPASCGIAFVAWGIWGALQSLAVAGYFPPAIAASAIHLIFAAAGFMLLAREDR